MPEFQVIASKMYMALLSDLKKASKLLKAKVKKGVRDSDKDPDELTSILFSQLTAHGSHIENLSIDSMLSDNIVRNIKLLPLLNVGYVKDALTSDADITCLKQHLLMLTMVAQAPNAVTEVLTEIKLCQSPREESDKHAISKLGKMLQASYMSGMDGLEKMFANTKIGDLAKEIAGEVDISAMGSAVSADMFSLQGLTDPNNPLASIINTVGSKIQSKIKNGELRQEDLLSEAMGMLKHVSPEMLSMFSAR